MSAAERVLRLLDTYAETRQSRTLIKLAAELDSYRRAPRHQRVEVESRLAEVLSAASEEPTDG